ncbi:hypothetical protein MMC09_004789 [Bachmanniomyces sp. S44760]|nr:hypothetical protein [Bachmanniomyces sp. S44760]
MFNALEMGRRSSSIIGFPQRIVKPAIEITLDDQPQGSFVPAFTTLDKIEGKVTITAPSPIEFQDIHITFQGSTRTFVEKVATAASANTRTQAYHNFLRLTQPIEYTDFPESRLLQGGRPYTFPFTFVVPERLLLQSCNHPRASDQIHDAHAILPPSFGDPMLSDDGKTMINDLSPEMTVISYALRVVVTKKDEQATKPIALADKFKKLRIVPAVEEQPPLSISSERESDYRMRKEKDIRKGLFKGRLGKLVVEAVQPKSLQLPPPGSQDACTPTTMAVVNLRFDPVDGDAQPPRLSSLTNKLKVATFFASAPMRDFPSKSTCYIYDTQKGCFVETISLSSRNMESVQWSFHPNSNSPITEDPVRRDSAFSTLSSPAPEDIPAPSASYAGKSFYTARFLVPVALPRCKTFVPSFHSCLISRIYVLDLVLTIQSTGRGSAVSNRNMHLKVPLQISSAGRPNAQPIISAEEAAAIAARQTSSDLLPRSFAPPSPEYTEHASSAAIRPLAPAIHQSPEYSESAEYVSSGSPRNTHRGSLRSPSVSGDHAAQAAPPGYSMVAGRSPGRSMRMERPAGLTSVGG